MRFVAAVALALLVAGAPGCKGKSKANQTSADKAGSAKPRAGSAREPRRMHMNAPKVDGPGVEPAHALSATIYYTLTDLSIGDETLAEFADGLVQPATLEYLVHTLEETVRSDDPVGLVLAGSLTINRLLPMLAALKTAGFHNLAMITSEGKLIPLALPDPAELGTGLRPVVKLESGMLSLFSLSGDEGTEVAPRFSSPLDQGFAPLAKALSELVKKRWGDAKRSPADLIVMVKIDRTQTVDTLMRLVATVRADASRALFPNVFLSVM